MCLFSNGFKFHTNSMRWELGRAITAPVCRIRLDIRHSVTFCRTCHRFLLLHGSLLAVSTCSIQSHDESWVFKSQYIYVTLHDDLISKRNFNIISNRNSHWFHYSSLVPFRNRYWQHIRTFLLFCFVSAVRCAVCYLSLLCHFVLIRICCWIMKNFEALRPKS